MSRRYATAFAGAAAEYERGRPGYADAAVEWLAGRMGLRPGRAVLDLAAGTGKLTRQLVTTGAEVVAVEPLDEMRAQLDAALPEVRVLSGAAEAIPLPDGSVDAVTVAQAFHWFDGPRAAAEIHRVLRPGGAIALIWNMRDLDDPLQAALEDVFEPLRRAAGLESEGEARDLFEPGKGFGPLEERRFPHEQRAGAAEVVDGVASRSFVAALGEEERAEVLERVRVLANESGEPIVLRLVTEVYVSDRR